MARTAFAAFETSLQKFIADRAVPGVQIAFSNADGFEISKACGKADVAVGNDLVESTLCGGDISTVGGGERPPSAARQAAFRGGRRALRARGGSR